MHVIAGLGTGGTEMMCLRLARHWQGRFEQHVLAWSSSSGSLRQHFQGISQTYVSVAPSDAQSYFERWRWIRKQIAQRKPDAIVLHCFGVPHLITALAARSAGAISVCAWAGNPPPRKRLAQLRFRAVLMASRIIRCPVLSCSRTVEQEFKQLGIGMPARSAIIPNAVDVADILAEARRSREMRTDHRPTIAMVSRLDVIKDHATLLKAFAIVRRDMPSAQLWIIGDGALRGNLEAQARALAIADSTMFFGNRTDVANLLGQVNVLAFSTTRDEGFGIVLIEAMAAGIPVVASDVAACREVLADGEAGLLVPPSDPAALASSIRQVLNSSELRVHFASRALHRVRSEYSIESCAQRWEAQLFDAPQPLDRLTECAS